LKTNKHRFLRNDAHQGGRKSPLLFFKGYKKNIRRE
jgi:hypothetical protein